MSAEKETYRQDDFLTDFEREERPQINAGLRQRRHVQSMSVLEAGKIPPQARDLEEVILGALMLEKEAIYSITDILKAEMFYVDANKMIFEAIIFLHGAGTPVDIMTVTARLKVTGQLDECGGAYAITMLTNQVASSANVRYHAVIIVQQFVKRELIRLGTVQVMDGYDDTVDALESLNEAYKKLDKLVETIKFGNSTSMTALVTKSIQNIEEAGRADDHLIGVPTYIDSLDRAWLGMVGGSLNIIAARPGMGKTAAMISMISKQSVIHKKPVGVFSLEMTSRELTQRLLANASQIDGELLKTGKLQPEHWDRLTHFAGDVGVAPIYIDDQTSATYQDIVIRSKKLKHQHGVEIIYIDYLQLIGLLDADKKNSNRDQQLGTITRALKTLAKELDIPVVAFCQLSRQADDKKHSKPDLSDLRESGNIEQDADTVVFLYRPHYYFKESKDAAVEDIDFKQTCLWICKKNRNGKLFDVKTRVFLEHFRFIEWSSTPQLSAGDAPPVALPEVPLDTPPF